MKSSHVAVRIVVLVALALALAIPALPALAREAPVLPNWPAGVWAPNQSVDPEMDAWITTCRNYMRDDLQTWWAHRGVPLTDSVDELCGLMYLEYYNTAEG